MKHFKKMMALVIAMVMIVGTMNLAAFAATGNLTQDTQVTVGGLDEGDQVSFYKLIKWVEGTGWAWNDGVSDAATSAGVTLPDLDVITGKYDTSTNPATYTAGVISAADGGVLAQVAQKLTVADQETVAKGATTVSYALGDEPTDAQKLAFVGLYVALVKPAKTDYVYNPIFVAADYNPDDTNTNEIEVAENELSYQPEAMAKKQNITLTKTSGDGTDTQYDVKVGDTISFTVDSIIPEFSTSYTDPVYEITDVMSTGLTLTTGSVNVTVADLTSDTYAAPASGAFTTTEGTPANGFTVAFDDDYLLTIGSAKKVKITYTAKVVSIDDTNIVKKDNTATVKFSNNPGNKDDYSLLEDKTYHYTFSLDANMLGNSSWENSELVKIGISADGTEITKSTLSNGTEAGILEGAVFGLYTDEACTTLYTNSENGTTGEFTSDPNGKLNISGLDAGTYYLKEISAPAGYIKSTDTWRIVITPHYTTVEGGEYTNEAGKKVKYDAYDYLDSYVVTVTNLDAEEDVTSNFTITNSGTEKKIATSSSADSTTKLSNTQGTELPSTGGMGTTLFYIIGAILVIGAGILLVTRRRMSAD